MRFAILLVIKKEPIKFRLHIAGRCLCQHHLNTIGNKISPLAQVPCVKWIGSQKTFWERIIMGYLEDLGSCFPRLFDPHTELPLGIHWHVFERKAWPSGQTVMTYACARFLRWCVLWLVWEASVELSDFRQEGPISFDVQHCYIVGFPSDGRNHTISCQTT